MKKKFILTILIIPIILGLTGCMLRPKIDETATSLYEYLLLEKQYGNEIDFDRITNGANCFTGKQETVIKTKKYGKVTAEFSYCNPKNYLYLHIYN